MLVFDVLQILGLHQSQLIVIVFLVLLLQAMDTALGKEVAGVSPGCRNEYTFNLVLTMLK